jgi:hypothetical protein
MTRTDGAGVVGRELGKAAAAAGDLAEVDPFEIEDCRRQASLDGRRRRR